MINFNLWKEIEWEAKWDSFGHNNNLSKLLITKCDQDCLIFTSTWPSLIRISFKQGLKNLYLLDLSFADQLIQINNEIILSITEKQEKVLAFIGEGSEI